MTDVDALLERLLAELGVSRVTLRLDPAGDGAWPVAHEALAPGAPSIRDERTVDLRRQPVAIIALTGTQVVQDDCTAAFADPEFERMLAAYGGLAAQVVTPVVVEGEVRAILSVHQLGAPRSWTTEEQETASRAAREIGGLL